MDEEEEETMQEELCVKEFGFELGEMKRRIHSHAENMDRTLHRFCSRALTPAADPSLRRQLGFTLITEMASSSKLATDYLTHTLVTMHSTLLQSLHTEHNMAIAAALSLTIKQTLLSIHARVSSDLALLHSHREKMKLHREIITAEKEKDMLSKQLASSKASFAQERARFSDEAVKLEEAMQRLEEDKAGIEAKARSKFEKEKALLELSLREEMQACQICLQNLRNVVILPCFHGQFCEDCLEDYKKTNNSCPICRSTIRGTHPYIA